MVDRIIKIEKAISIHEHQIAKEEQRKKEFERTLKEARKDVLECMDGQFSYGDIEDLLLGYGLEMDYIEDMI